MLVIQTTLFFWWLHIDSCILDNNVAFFQCLSKMTILFQNLMLEITNLQCKTFLLSALHFSLPLSVTTPPPFSSFSCLEVPSFDKFSSLSSFVQWPHPSPCLPKCPPWRHPLQSKKLTVPSFSLQHGRKHKCPLKGEWVSNMWYTHTMEYYSALKGKEILTHHNMDELRRHYNNWNKLVTKRQASHDSTYIQSSSVAQSCPTLCDPVNRSTPGLPVHHKLPEFTQAHVHQVGDAIQPSHPLSSPSPAPNPSQHQGLFQWVSSSHEVAKVLEFQLQHQSFQWTTRTYIRCIV